MTLHAITVCHMEPEIIMWSLMRFQRTTEVTPNTWTVLDNCWPLDAKKSSELLDYAIRILPWQTQASLIPLKKNIGGTAGTKYAIEMAEPKDDDLVLIYDPDSNPRTSGWLEAMLAVMEADPTLGYVSLLDNRNSDRQWAYETIAGHKVAFIGHPEMWNVTLFRGSALKKGFIADSDKWNAPFYGHVETAFFRHVRELGMRNGYMFDFREDKCPIEHPKAYTKWKTEHAMSRYPGNFDAYCIEKGIK